VVLDASALDTGVEIVSRLVLEVGGEFFAQEGGDVVGLDGVNSRAYQARIQGCEVFLSGKDEVGGILDLHQAPMVGVGKFGQDRAIARDEGIEFSVQSLDREGIGELLGFLPIGDSQESVIQRREANAL